MPNESNAIECAQPASKVRIDRQLAPIPFHGHLQHLQAIDLYLYLSLSLSIVPGRAVE